VLPLSAASRWRPSTPCAGPRCRGCRSI